MIAHYEAESQYKLQSSDDATTTTPFSSRTLNERPEGVESVRDHWISVCKIFVSSGEETQASTEFFVPYTSFMSNILILVFIAITSISSTI